MSGEIFLHQPLQLHDFLLGPLPFVGVVLHHAPLVPARVPSATHRGAYLLPLLSLLVDQALERVLLLISPLPLVVVLIQVPRNPPVNLLRVASGEVRRYLQESLPLTVSELGPTAALLLPPLEEEAVLLVLEVVQTAVSRSPVFDALLQRVHLTRVPLSELLAIYLLVPGFVFRSAARRAFVDNRQLLPLPTSTLLLRRYFFARFLFLGRLRRLGICLGIPPGRRFLPLLLLLALLLALNGVFGGGGVFRLYLLVSRDLIILQGALSLGVLSLILLAHGVLRSGRGKRRVRLTAAVRSRAVHFTGEIKHRGTAARF
mmetsp:Transcript_29417/g.72815  ORF Transcript_29417/g.72815 Transcript_29417/m.72815 type:complete len:316 (+) Transcript_29417:450-1397(+)